MGDTDELPEPDAPPDIEPDIDGLPLDECDALEHAVTETVRDDMIVTEELGENVSALD